MLAIVAKLKQHGKKQSSKNPDKEPMNKTFGTVKAINVKINAQ